MIKIGVRVIRGPDWDHGSHEDGGPGHLGTIIDISRKSQTCTVQWDNGNLTNCQASDDHKDLRIVYTESTVSMAYGHFGYCDVCNDRSQLITGLRFKCVPCKDYDLCMKCYMGDEHNKNHAFVRLNYRLGKAIPLLPRIKTKRTKIFGFGPGASIMLTPFATSTHMEDIGRILELDDAEGGTAKIQWTTGEDITHSTGKDGIVEIKLVETHHVGHVYIDHIPVADMSLPVESCINIGDKVCVNLNTDTLKGLMQDYGGWNDGMEKILGETGEVVGLPSRLQCEVYYKNVSRTWILYIASLRKMSIPAVGDRVTVLADADIVRSRQGYSWKDDMRKFIGKSGRVENVDELGDITVKFSAKKSLVYSPSCVVKDDDQSPFLMGEEESSSSESETSSVEVVITGNHSDDQDPCLGVRKSLLKLSSLLGSQDESISSDEEDNNEDISSDEEDSPRIINTHMVIGPGLRVVRGRDWKWTDQDGGEGHLGTVQEVSEIGKASCPDNCAAVLWDNGYRNTYRIGLEDCYDLRIYDNAGVAGNRHTDVKCTERSCPEEEDDIMGFVWQSQSNEDVILCNTCYHSDKGDVTQSFIRIDYPGHVGVKVPKRQMAQRQKLIGIDIGAKVLRGPNWRWANQDGGHGQIGEVIAIVNFSLDTDRDAAEVTWGNDHTNVYRLGFEGSVDLKLESPGSAKYYYRLHLPELRMPQEPVQIPHPESPEGAEPDITVDDGRLKPGDTVQIGVDPDVLQSIHKEMKIWKDQMIDTIGLSGTVQSVDGVYVSAEFGGQMFTLHQITLKKIQVFREGEFVKIATDYDKVQKLQNGHGDWNEFTIKSLGKKGQVQSINVDGDVKVRFSDMVLTYNPECLSKASEGPADTLVVVERSPSPPPLQRERPSSPQRVSSVDFKTAVMEDMEDDVLIHLNSSGENKQKLVRGQANFHPVYIACKNGHAGVLKALLQFADSAAVEESDEQNTPLQIAVKKKYTDCVDLLLSYNAKKDVVNDHSQTVVHLAVKNRDVTTLRVLRKHKCDINKKDALGDSAVVDAIVRQHSDNMEMLDVILDWPGIDLDFENINGFSPIHIAARKGDLGALKSLLKKDDRLLNKEKSDGYTPLHLAACTDHYQVIQFLLDQPGLNVEARTKDKGQTALLIACFYGSKKTVETLLNEKDSCQADVKDVDDNNALHLCLSGPPQVMEIGDVQRSYPRLDDDKKIKPQLELAQLLLDKGVPYKFRNKAGKLPEEIASIEKLKTDFKAMLNARSSLEQHRLCPLCNEEGNEVYSVYMIKPCQCALCNGCFMPKFKRCPNCGSSIESFSKLKMK